MYSYVFTGWLSLRYTRPTLCGLKVKNQKTEKNMINKFRIFTSEIFTFILSDSLKEVGWTGKMWSDMGSGGLHSLVLLF
jgi:hypothetical protein